jgi:Secretion system C-terminal sorting domain
MKKIYVNLCMIFTCVSLSAGTPVIDGTFDGTSVWGAARAISDLVPGWPEAAMPSQPGANAKKIYVTADASYIYIGAEVKVASWMQFAFLINTKSGGGTADSWGRAFTYGHADKPDYIFRGNFGEGNMDGSSYAEFHTWSGSAWTGVGTKAASTEYADNIPNNFTSSDGFIEVRIARNQVNFKEDDTDNNTQSRLLDITAMEVQLVLTGDNNDHGSFDALPDQTNANNWNMTATPNSVDSYISSISLPIELTQFTAKSNNSTINLAWQTASEKSNSHFDIERSANGKEWSKIGMVKGSGTTQQRVDYRFSDETPLSNLNYYRLKQVDFDGQFNYSPVVTAVVGKGKLKGIFPNPTADKINLIGNDLTNDDIVTIFDLNGRNVKTQKVNGAQIDVSDLTKGFYILSVSDINGQVSERIRFVKQ